MGAVAGTLGALINSFVNPLYVRLVGIASISLDYIAGVAVDPGLYDALNKSIQVSIVAGGGGPPITNYALETGGHLASLDTKLPAQGQALAAASVPVVLTAAQVSTLTPLAAVSPLAATTGGATPYHYIAAAATACDAQVVKASPGTLYSVAGMCAVATPRYLKLYDTIAGSAPASTDTPVHTLMMPANSTTGAGFTLSFPVGLAFASKISFRLTTGMADNDTGACTAGDCVISLGYK